MRASGIPAPETRVPVDLYVELRQWLLANDPDGQEMLNWSTQEIGFPATAEDMAGEIIWIILCAGRSAQAARTIEKRVWAALRVGRPVVEAFGYRAKAEAIERAWRECEKDYAALREVGTGDVEKLVAWCGSLPFVGDDTQFQLAKNFGSAARWRPPRATGSPRWTACSGLPATRACWTCLALQGRFVSGPVRSRRDRSCRPPRMLRRPYAAECGIHECRSVGRADAAGAASASSGQASESRAGRN